MNNLIGRVLVAGVASHKIHEGVERDEAGVARVHNGHDSLKVGVALLVVADVVAERDETRAELFGVQAAQFALVEVIEGHAELVHLVLAYAFRVSGEYLIFDFIYVTSDRHAQLFPAHADRLHCVGRVTVLEDQCLLNFLYCDGV